MEMTFEEWFKCEAVEQLIHESTDDHPAPESDFVTVAEGHNRVGYWAAR